MKTENWNHAGMENSSSSTRGTKKSVHWIHPVYYTCVRNKLSLKYVLTCYEIEIWDYRQVNIQLYNLMNCHKLKVLIHKMHKP